MKLLVCAALVLCVATMALSLPYDNDTYQFLFAKWMIHHKRSYSSHEFQQRFAIWRANFDYIQDHNSKNLSFTVAVNQFADLTNREFNLLYKGLLRQVPIKQTNLLAHNGEFVDPSLPAEVDWRKQGAVTAVKNQGQCGSCWSFSATGSMEGQHKLVTGSLVGLSEQNLVDCSTAQGNAGCNGGLMDYAFQYVIQNHGIDTEASYPYTATGPNACRFRRNDVGATISTYRDVPSGSEAGLQQAVANVGPISIGIDASHNSFQFYSGGVYYEPDCSSSQLDHGVLAVGYGTDGGKAYWLVKNSWGPSWGLSGYIMMSRDRNNNCGVATAASYPCVNGCR